MAGSRPPSGGNGKPTFATPAKSVDQVSSGTRYVQVTFPRPLADLYTYSIPESLRGLVIPGMRVRVPLGNRNNPVVGFAVSLSESCSLETRIIKQVLGLVDRVRVVDEVMLEFTRWLAEYYLCSWGEVLAAAVPPGGGPADCRLQEVVSLDTGRLCPDGIPSNATARRRVMDRLLEFSATRTEIPVSTVLKSASVPKRVITEMNQRGLIHLEQRESLPGPVELPPVAEGIDPATIELTGEQHQALNQVNDRLMAGGFSAWLLHGVTGSGKTEIYLRAAATAIRSGRGVLYLVPEIALTPVLAEAIRRRFGDRVALLHSGLPVARRRDEWLRVRHGAAHVVLGVRSALFAPLRNIGLVIVDEEHESTYKAGDTPRLHARDMAVLLARRHEAVAILGSATPSLESYANVDSKKYGLLELTRRIHRRPMAQIEIVDMAEEFVEQGKQVILSRTLVESLNDTIERGEQAMVLLNRRGYAAFLLCRECGTPAVCSNCSVNFTYHRGMEKLQCHHCGTLRPLPERCERCGGTFLQQVGMGTEKVEEELNLLFPEIDVDRMDQDSTRRRGSAWRILRSFAEGRTKILVGTQMIAKGHDFHRVTLVGILNADSSLGLPDFRTGERTFQLLTQASGRAGRGEKSGQVIIQTFTPDHYAIRSACKQDYHRFYRIEMEHRRRIGYPPAVTLANIITRGRESLETAEYADRLGDLFRRLLPSRGIRLFGPVPAPLWRLKNQYRYQMIARSRSRRQLSRYLAEVRQQASQKGGFNTGRFSIDMDAHHLL